MKGCWGNHVKMRTNDSRLRRVGDAALSIPMVAAISVGIFGNGPVG